MRERIQLAVKHCDELDTIAHGVSSVFIELQQEGCQRIGYVSGIITSDGPEYITRNVTFLDGYTKIVSSQVSFPVFSATDVFTDEVFNRIDAFNLPSSVWMPFGAKVLITEPQFVTDMFMAPRWESSNGARSEHLIAQRRSMNIDYRDYRRL